MGIVGRGSSRYNNMVWNLLSELDMRRFPRNVQMLNFYTRKMSSISPESETERKLTNILQFVRGTSA